MNRPTAPAATPPPGLDGLDPAWSRLVTARDSNGVERTWHVLDSWHGTAAQCRETDPELTLLCVHGNPSWSYLFRDLVRRATSASTRVVAVDHLDMGFSERTGTVRRLATRVDDLGAVTDALGLTGPVITVAHDWGGPISLGWALAHRDQLRGIVLMNTAVHQPAGSPAPSVIRLVRSTPMLAATTTSTTAFIRGAFALSDRRPSAAVRAGFLAPYGTAARRHAIADFVADIPLEPEHPSASALDSIAVGLCELADVPALLVWGAGDRVFSDLYLHDLEARLPHADVHRFPNAGHFVSEDEDAASIILDWTAALSGDDRAREPGHSDDPSPLLQAREVAGDDIAIAEMDESANDITFADLARRVDGTARALVATGVSRADRVALMIPPGIDLAVALSACWHVGATVVFIDSGLGASGMNAAIRSANPQFMIGIPKALTVARTLRWPGRRIAVDQLGAIAKRALGADDLASLTEGSDHVGLPESPTTDVLAAVVFTSGSTGPSKGVRYTHRQIAAQCDALRDLYAITPDDRLVAAFAPFAVYGPLLGITSVVPAMDVTAPATLTAGALGDAVARIDATLVFASPAALAGAVATRHELTATHRAAFERVRLVLSAGAPVGTHLLGAAAALFPNAELCTPYGMTECLPVANISLDQLDALRDGDRGDGVCVGLPMKSVDVAIRPFDEIGRSGGELTTQPGVAGEIIVRAPHQRDGYDRLWHTEHLASTPTGWHATGDVGHLDPDGRLWVGGRTTHVIATADGPIMPVRIEQAAETIDGIAGAAAVGIGPIGCQQVAVVLQRTDPARTAQLADVDLTTRVRTATGAAVVAVFEVPELPVDRRHNSKVDRTRLATWAAEALAGGRLTRP